MKRRELLAVLALTGLESLSGCAGLTDRGEGVLEGVSDQVDGMLGGQTQTPTVTQSGPTNRIQVIQSQLHAIRNQREDVPRIRLNFDYEPRTFTDIADPNFEAIAAEPSSRMTGDRLQIVPRDVTSAELSARLRIVWGVEDRQHVTRSISGTDVTFSGGVTNGYALLTGVLSANARDLDQERVLVTRANSIADARILTGEFGIRPADELLNSS